MKKWFAISLLLFTGILAEAQQSWTVQYQQKTVLKKTAENPEKNIIRIKKSSLLKPGNLVISFTIHDGTVNRTLMADDSSRSGIKSWENVKKSIAVSTSTLKTLFKERSTLIFSVTEIPKDPAKAAVVRMRPVELFKLLLY